MGRMIKRLYAQLIAYLPVLLARRGIFLAPAYPIPVGTEDYWWDEEYDEIHYRHNAHSIMRESGQIECTTAHPDDFCPGTVFGCVACDVEGGVYTPMSLFQRIVLGTRHNRVLMDAMNI